MRTIGAFFLAVGSGLGTWAITHTSDTGIEDLAIVALFIAVGATLIHAREKKDDEADS